MNNLFEMVFIGIWATIFMDLISIILVKLRAIKQLIGAQEIGRWVINMMKGKFSHDDIRKSPEFKNEKFIAQLTHYLIGIFLAGVYLFLNIVCLH